MATSPQPSINFHARIDLDTEKRRRRLQAETGLSVSRLVKEAFHHLERRLSARRRKSTREKLPGLVLGPAQRCIDDAGR
jgi:hypothetical protein